MTEYLIEVVTALLALYAIYSAERNYIKRRNRK
jgi:hypothetical protein